MNIVINAFSARRGGGQTYLKQILKNFDDPNLKVYVLTPSSLSFQTGSENIIKVKVNWPTENPFLRFLWEVFFLPGYLIKVKADVLFCPGGLVNCYIPAGCSVVTTFQNMIPFMPDQRAKFPAGYMRLRHWLLEKGLSRGMERSDLVIFLSNFAKEVVSIKLGGKLKKTIVISHGLSEEFRENINLQRPGWMPTDEYILYVSDFNEYKNQREVVQAYALLKNARRTQEKLVLIGYNETFYGEQVRTEIIRLGLEKDVLIFDLVDYKWVPGLYQFARIVIFASTCENCPNILLEAMGMGRPLLVSNRQPMPEFAQDAALYFDPEFPKDLCQKLLDIIDQPMVLAELSGKAQALSKNYDWKQTAKKTWTAFWDLKNNKKIAFVP